MGKRSDGRWADLQDIRGLRVLASYDDLSDAVKEAVLTRNPKNCMYQPVDQTPPYNGEAYAERNELLHERMTAAARTYFKDTSIDDDYPGEADTDFLEEIGTPFTYQNGDWYQPTYECYIGVLLPYVSSAFLLALQRLLTAEFGDWCIVVVLCEDSSFGDGEEVYLFSDQALLDLDAAELLQLPSR